MRVNAMRVLLVGISGLLIVTLGTAAGAVPRSAHASPKYVFGIDTFVADNCQPQSLIDQWATTQVSQFKALGANAIGLAFPLYTASLTSNNVYAKSVCNYSSIFQSPTPAVLASIVTIAHNAGLEVALRPLVDERLLKKKTPSSWRGILAPKNPNAWFKSYLRVLRPYLLMAQANNVQFFSISTELNSLAHAEIWPGAISSSRKIYKGGLEFTYSWATPVTKTWQGGTSNAIDAYPKIPNAKSNESVKVLVSQWNHLLKAQSIYKIPNISAVTIDEVGITAQDGEYQNPSVAGLSFKKHPFNQAIQGHWFTAACDFMKQHKMRGIFYWGPWLGIDSGLLPVTPDPKLATDIQPAGQAAIEKCFA